MPRKPGRKAPLDVVTSKEQASKGLTNYICQNCRREAMEPNE